MTKAQTNGSANFPKIDASPLDVVYFPLNVTKAKDNAAPLIRVLYARPNRSGREIFGVLEQYGKVWRFGANENTEIHFFKNVHIGGKKIRAGRYSLFAIPNKDNWTLIVNKQTDKWGAFSYDLQKDIVRVTVPVEKLEKTIEIFSITFNEILDGANMIMAWDKTQASLPIKFTK